MAVTERVLSAYIYNRICNGMEERLSPSIMSFNIGSVSHHCKITEIFGFLLDFCSDCAAFAYLLSFYLQHLFRLSFTYVVS